MSDRGGVRSSARLSGDGSAVVAAPPAARAQGRGRPVSTTAAAASRRARAAERAAEVEDSPRVLREKCRRLARALRNAKHLVVYTGAGISTAADIPDYRGPHGVWTRLQRGETVGRVEVSRAQPTFTHMALTALWARGALKFVVSQNCDGLHLRAGLPRRALAELHGDMFAELCAPCRRVYLRAFDTTERTARHAHGTRRLCHACGAELRDSIVHFGERGRAAWPLNWAGALRHAARADVVLCLGSSLKVLRRYPRLWRMQAAPRARPALYIVNLQWTPKDSVAALKINARCDAVMQQVARRLRLRVPRYRAALDPVLAHAEPLAEPERHTTRRPPLSAPGSPAAAPEHWEPSSPSASDSDEEVPLRHLAARLRGPTPPPASGPAGRPALLSGQPALWGSHDLAACGTRPPHSPSRHLPAARALPAALPHRRPAPLPHGAPPAQRSRGARRPPRLQAAAPAGVRAAHRRVRLRQDDPARAAAEARGPHRPCQGGAESGAEGRAQGGARGLTELVGVQRGGRGGRGGRGRRRLAGGRHHPARGAAVPRVAVPRPAHHHRAGAARPAGARGARAARVRVVRAALRGAALPVVRAGARARPGRPRVAPRARPPLPVRVLRRLGGLAGAGAGGGARRRRLVRQGLPQGAAPAPVARAGRPPRAAGAGAGRRRLSACCVCVERAACRSRNNCEIAFNKVNLL